MKNGRPQAKDIVDRDMLSVVDDLSKAEVARGLHCGWVCTWDVEARFAAMPAPVVRAKLEALVRRKMVDGCSCGCRGDFVLLPAGRALLEAA